MPLRLIVPPERGGRPPLGVRLMAFLIALGTSVCLAKLTFTGLLNANFDTESAGDLAVVVFTVSLALGVLIYFAWYFASQIKGVRLDIVTIALALQDASERSIVAPDQTSSRHGKDGAQ